MSKLSFRDLFKHETLEREETSFVPPLDEELLMESHLVQGQLFRGLELDDRLADAAMATILFISLTCTSCIDLLSDLAEFGARHEGLLLVVSSGSNEDNEELVRYYDYSFPVLTMQERAYKARFELEATPAAIMLEHGRVMKQFTILDIGHLYDQSAVRKGGD
ncbi:hypothetical protein [Paenibacillus antarcticus]|uniref:Alkyl hydroperoxide reductase subunit C/ Thiol specific antioxidant domain-containing protein n=1 Tax=Paenibacillus antarcticus TaxID=253703 RepID=A0A168JVB0_9BACL|nr:hypothetical protein [Paenibacillus antarcticus]OAB41155.1 hypothetical protein PBAT_21580 [Paenibacillus antarcticus]